MNGQELIVVAGATGRQGGAVANQLLKSGAWRVRGLTRDPESPAARALSERGAEVVRADLNDPHTLLPALQGAHGVFSVQNYWEAGADGELLQGKNLADAAEAARVKHLVYSSVGGAERDSGLEHFDTKWQIEQHLRLLGLRHTVLRPVFFMENLLGPQMREAILAGTLPLALPPDIKLQMIAVSDIGAFAALAFAHPDQFEGKALELAGDELTMPEAAGQFEEALGHPVRHVVADLEEVRRASPDYAAMLEWFVSDGYHADIAALRRLHPELMDFAHWVAATGWGGLAARRAA